MLRASVRTPFSITWCTLSLADPYQLTAHWQFPRFSILLPRNTLHRAAVRRNAWQITGIFSANDGWFSETKYGCTITTVVKRCPVCRLRLVV